MYTWTNECVEPSVLMLSTENYLNTGTCVSVHFDNSTSSWPQVTVVFKSLPALIEWIEHNYNLSDGFCEDESNKLQKIYGIKEC